MASRVVCAPNSSTSIGLPSALESAGRVGRGAERLSVTPTLRLVGSARRAANGHMALLGGCCLRLTCSTPASPWKAHPWRAARCSAAQSRRAGRRCRTGTSTGLQEVPKLGHEQTQVWSASARHQSKKANRRSLGTCTAQRLPVCTPSSWPLAPTWPDMNGSEIDVGVGVVRNEVLVPFGGPRGVWVAGVERDGRPANKRGSFAC